MSEPVTAGVGQFGGVLASVTSPATLRGPNAKENTYRWATVTTAYSPGTASAAIQLDGDTAPLPFTPEFLIDPATLNVGARVWTQLFGRRVLVIGAAQARPSGGVQTLVPVGAIMWWTLGGTVPTGWLRCNGASLARTAYPALYAVLSTNYGSVDGNSFNIPDLRGRVVLGANPTYPIYSTGGAASVTLTPGMIPPHTHNLAHSHTINSRETGPGTQNNQVMNSGGVGTQHPDNTAINNATGTTGDGSGQGLGGTATPTMPPYLALDGIIKF